jgi:hypothetical protein
MSNTVPFKIESFALGLAESHGLLRIEDGSLLFEYQTKDGILGLIKTAVKIVRIQIADLTDVGLDKSMFSTRLILRARSMMALKGLPGTESDEAVLTIRRSDRQRASALISELDLLISQNKLAAIRPKDAMHGL